MARRQTQQQQQSVNAIYVYQMHSTGAPYNLAVISAGTAANHDNALQRRKEGNVYTATHGSYCCVSPDYGFFFACLLWHFFACFLLSCNAHLTFCYYDPCMLHLNWHFFQISRKSSNFSVRSHRACCWHINSIKLCFREMWERERTCRLQ